MANSSNRLVVEVVGDTSKLTRDLAKAQTEINRFAGKSQIKSTGADALLADVRKMKDETGVLQKRLQGLPPVTDKATSSFGRMGVALAAVGVGLDVLGAISAGLKVSGDEATTTGGKWRNAAAELLAFHPAQALLAFDAEKTTGSIEQLTEAINRDSVGIDHHVGAVTRDIDAIANLIGIDRQRERQLERLTNLSELYAQAIDDKVIGALGRLKGASIDVGSALAFGERGTAEGRGPGAIATETSGKPLPGPTVGISQRLQTAIALAKSTKEKADDLAQFRRAITTLNKQLTQANLTDADKETIANQITSYQSEIDSILKSEKDANVKIKKAVVVKKKTAKSVEELRRERISALTAKQFRELGLAPDGTPITPGADNLRKRVGSLSDRIAGTRLDTPKLQAQLARFRKVLSEGLVPKDVRARIDDMLKEISSALNAGTKQGGPLTKTTQLSSERILAGLGLDPSDAKTILARLSHFNSSGTALSGTGAGSMSLTVPVAVVVDGKVVAKASAKYNRRSRSVNTSQRNGPNAARGTGPGI